MRYAFRKKKHRDLAPLIKRGIGEHIYLMFAGRTGKAHDAEVLARPHGLRKIVPVLLLIGVACMISIVLWRHISAVHSVTIR